MDGGLVAHVGTLLGWIQGAMLDDGGSAAIRLHRGHLECGLSAISENRFDFHCSGGYFAWWAHGFGLISRFAHYSVGFFREAFCMTTPCSGGIHRGKSVEKIVEVPQIQTVEKNCAGRTNLRHAHANAGSCHNRHAHAHANAGSCHNRHADDNFHACHNHGSSNDQLRSSNDKLRRANDFIRNKHLRRSNYFCCTNHFRGRHQHDPLIGQRRLCERRC